MKAPTKAEMVERLAAAERETSARAICMSAMVDGAVQWMGGRAASRKAHRLGLVRPASASGGWVIHVYKPETGAVMTECHLLDDFDRQTQDACRFSGEREEAAYLRSLCAEALRVRHEVLQAPEAVAP